MPNNFNHLTGDLNNHVIYRYEKEKTRGWELMGYFFANSWCPLPQASCRP